MIRPTLTPRIIDGLGNLLPTIRAAVDCPEHSELADCSETEKHNAALAVEYLEKLLLWFNQKG